MNKVFTEVFLHNAWGSDFKVRHDGQTYRVGRMSYGDYFLEPGEPKGETKPFNRGTVWLERSDKTLNNDGETKLYEVSEILND